MSLGYLGLPEARSQSEDYGVLEALLDTDAAQARKLTLAQLQGATPEERLAWRWLLVNEKALAETRQLSNCQWLVYEDLCRDPATTGRQLFESCGLTWDAQCAAFLGASTSQANEHYYSGVQRPPRGGQPLAPGAAGRDRRPGASHRRRIRGGTALFRRGVQGSALGQPPLGGRSR